MGHSGIYCYKIPGRDGLRFSALNTGSLGLTLGGRFWINDGATGDQCRASLLHNHHVIEVGVDFCAAA